MGYQLRREGDGGAIKYYSLAPSPVPATSRLRPTEARLRQTGRLPQCISDYGASPKPSHRTPSRSTTAVSMTVLGTLRAYADFSAAIELVLDNPDFYHNRAFCLRKLERLTEAVRDYTQSPCPPPPLQGAAQPRLLLRAPGGVGPRAEGLLASPGHRCEPRGYSLRTGLRVRAHR